MNLKSFGCSFIFGTDLPDSLPGTEYPTPSQYSWPALMAKQLGWEYHCYARGGSGNLQILDRVLSHAASSTQDDFFVIGWTFQDRFDFVDRDEHRWTSWETLRPSLDHPHADRYFRDLHSQYRDKFTTLVDMYAAIQLLKSRRIPFIMTTVDDTPFETQWHATPSVSVLQDNVYRYISWLDNKNFLTWTRDNGYPISDTMHPLTEAHARAAEIMLPLAEARLRNVRS